MSLDGIMLSAIKEDLINNLIDGRIDKIYQNNNNTITMIVRNNNYNYKLLLSSHPQFARLHITEKNYDNPVKPPDFCMLLRKYITRGTIVSIEQPDFERIITLNINAYNKSYYLIIEVMGKYSNIILVDSNGIVLDSIKRITSVMSSERELYPGIKYKYPPKQDKSNPLYISEDEFIDKIGDFTQASYKAIMYNFRGIGPYSAREIVYRANIAPTTNYNLLNTAERNDLWKSYSNIINKTKEGNLEATAGIEDDKIKYLSAFPLLHLEDECDYKIFNDTGKLLDFYFTKNISGKEIKSIKKQLNDIADNYLGKNLKKQKKFRQKYKEGKNAKQFKKKGELITANIYQIKRGMKEIEVVDYYDEEQKNIKINLDPKLSPSENAQKYFKKYNKAKKSIKHIKVQLSNLRHEEKYLEQILMNIEQAENKQELEEIKDELISEGYIKEKKKHNQKKKHSKSLPPHKFKSSDGYDILVGRNNHQNDYLTKKLANSKDLWLHIKDMAGSHVIIRNHTRDEVPEKTIREAASIAAYYSKGRLSENVAIDFTEVKNVKKPKAAKPGLVYYEDYQTVFVNPDKELVEQLKK